MDEIKTGLEQLDHIMKEHNFPKNDLFGKQLLQILKNKTRGDELGILVSILRNF